MEALRRAEWEERCYFRLFQRGKHFTVVEMQPFDEPDYDQARFLNDIRYATEPEAQSVCDEVVDFLIASKMESLSSQIRPKALWECYLEATEQTHKQARERSGYYRATFVP